MAAAAAGPAGASATAAPRCGGGAFPGGTLAHDRPLPLVAAGWGEDRRVKSMVCAIVPAGHIKTALAEATAGSPGEG
ncbi:hypothetical protein GCM10023237_30380 [Streptomyces coeruleoprunus]